MKKLFVLIVVLLFAFPVFAGTITFVQNGAVTDADNNFTANQTMPSVKIITGANDGYVLTSDADGDATWQAASGGGVSDLSVGASVYCNLEISGSTLTIGKTGSDDCLVGVRSSTSGEATTATFSSGVAVTFGATSDTDGNLFGITDANWSDNMPWFVGVIVSGVNKYFTLSRVPYIESGSNATDLCQLGDTDCDLQTDVMIAATGLTLANWTGKPITQAGWFSASYATASSAWTFSVSANGNEGFNNAYRNVWSDYPVGQNGAIENTRLLVFGGDQSGDVPKWATPANIVAKYRLFDNMVQYIYNTANAGNVTNGDRGTTISTTLPLASYSPTVIGGPYRFICGSITTAGGVKILSLNLVNGDASPETISRDPVAGINGNSFTSSDDDYHLDATYPLF